MKIRFKGYEIAYVQHNKADRTYSLYGPDDLVQWIITEQAYICNAKLGSLPHGRHRRTNSPGNSSPLTLADYAKRTIADITGFDPGADDDTYGTSPIITALPRATWRLINNTGFEERLKPPLKRDGIIAGEIIGYRCWRIEDGLLRSVYQKDIWQPQAVLEGRELGDWDERGIHAWKDPASKQYHDYIRVYLNEPDDMYSRFIFGRNRNNTRPAMATGTVFLWGDVVEHVRGYRAEYARVRSLDWLYPDADMMGRETIVLDDLRRTYNVE